MSFLEVFPFLEQGSPCFGKVKQGVVDFKMLIEELYHSIFRRMGLSYRMKC